jgi:hypothetical protein
MIARTGGPTSAARGTKTGGGARCTKSDPTWRASHDAQLRVSVESSAVGRRVRQFGSTEPIPGFAGRSSLRTLRADLLARSIIEPLKPPALLGDLDSAALGTHPDFAQPLASCAPRLGRHPFAGPVEVPLSLCQRRLGVGQLFPQPTLALTLGLEPRECIGILSAARLEHRLDRLSQQLPRPGSPDMSGENKKQLRVPIERLGELHERLGDGPLDLTRLDPADLRSREAAPPANWFSCCEAARCGAVSGRRVLSTREAREDRCAFLASLGSTSSRAANHVPLEGDARRVSSRDSGSPGETCRCG